MDKSTKRNIVIGVVGAVVIIGTGVFFYNQYKKNNPPPQAPSPNKPNNPNNNSSIQANTNTGATTAKCNGVGCVSYLRMFFDPSYAYGVIKRI